MLNITDDEQCRILLKLLWQESITGLALVDESGKFITANPAFCKMVEYTEFELQHKKFQDITDPADLEADIAMSKLVASGEMETYDMTKAYITKTKNYLPILLRVTGLRMNGKFMYFVAEIAPLERDHKNETSPVQERVSKQLWNAKLLQFIRDNWVPLAVGATIFMAVLERFLEHYWPLIK